MFFFSVSKDYDQLRLLLKRICRSIKNSWFIYAFFYYYFIFFLSLCTVNDPLRSLLLALVFSFAGVVWGGGGGGGIDHVS